MVLAVKVGEHDFMGEERRPFKSFGAIGVCAADKLMLAIGLANQFGVAELANWRQPGWAAAWGEDPMATVAAVWQLLA